MALFKDRQDAGRQLARRLTVYAGRPDVLVLALPRGGVPVAAEIAAALDVPLDVFLVRKIGVPSQPELAMGAIAEGGVRRLNHALIHDLGIPDAVVEQVSARERLELDRRSRAFRGSRRSRAIEGRTIILVDDGLATGSTMEAAVVALRARKPARIVIGVPVGARDACARLGPLADELIAVHRPDPFQAVGLWYDDFTQTTDEDVIAALTQR